MIKSILITIMLLTMVNGTKLSDKDKKELIELEKEFLNLTVEQIDTLRFIRDAAMEHNLVWSLTAIGWEESKFNVYSVPVNNSGDYGLFKINIYWHLKRLGLKDTIWNRSKFGTRLIKDDHYNLDTSIGILRAAERQKKSWESYRVVWSIYNSGNRDASGMEYARRIALKVKILKEHMESI